MPSQIKIVTSGNLKGLNNSQRTSNNNTLDTFMRCYNCYTSEGALVKMRPYLYDSSIHPDAVYNTSNGTGICYVPMSATSGYLIIINDKEIKYTTITAANLDGSFDYGAINAIQTLANSPNGGSADYSFARFIDGSSNNLLFFQNGSTNYNLHVINLGTLAYSHSADAFLAGTKAVCVNQGLLYAAVNDKLYFSKIDDGTDFDTTWFLQIPDKGAVIQDLFVINEFVIIFCDSAIYTLTGNSTSTFDMKRLSNVGIGFGSRVDGSVNECYYVDTNMKFRKLSYSANYAGIDTSIDISNGILSSTEIDVNDYPSGASNFKFVRYNYSKVYQKNNFVYFHIQYSYFDDSITYAVDQTYVYNTEDKSFTVMTIYFDTTTYTGISRIPLSGSGTKNGNNLPYTNTVLSLAYGGRGIYQLTQVPHTTEVTETGVGANRNAFGFETGRITLGNNNTKTLQKLFFDFSVFGTAGEISLGISVYDEEETLLFGPSATTDYFTIDVNVTKWLTLPRKITSRAFYIRVVTDYTGGLRLNKWGIQYIDRGFGAHNGA